MRGRMKMNCRHTLAIAAFTLTWAAPCLAESAVEGASSCPTGAVSVYFAPGESLASVETVDLIGRVGEVATECNADGVDLVAWVDPAEGQAAMSLALDRLKLVSQRLSDSGLASGRMRVGARVQVGPERTGPGARNVRIILRDSDAMTRTETAPAETPRKPVIAPNAV